MTVMPLFCAIVILTGYISVPIDNPVCKELCESHEGVHVIIQPKFFDKTLCQCNDGKENWITKEDK